MAKDTYEMAGLRLDPEILGNYSMADGNEYLSPLGKLNILIGTNNSGKSRLLRGILMIEKPSYLPTGFDYEEIQATAARFVKRCEEIFDQSAFIEIAAQGGVNIVQSLKAINPKASFGEDPGLIPSLQNFISAVQNLNEKGPSSTTTSTTGKTSPILFHDPRQVGSALHSIVFGEFKDFQSSLATQVRKPKKFEKLYIPIMRGLRPPVGIDDDIYHKRTTKDYFTHSDGGSVKYPDIEIFSGLAMYSAIRSHLLGSFAERRMVQKYETYLSEKFFEGKRVTLIPRGGQDVLTIKVGTEVEKEIFNVGDGIQSLVAITFPLFEHSELAADKPLLVCIEEPEILVHPGLQRTLMTELLTSPKYKNIQFFVTTHSNHFLDLTLDYPDVSIFRVRKQLDEVTEEEESVPQFVIENVSNKDKQTLELLGVKNSSVFLSNATIWVEGITDRMYLRKAFGLWQANNKSDRTFKEDAHYSFVEYGGSNLPHWDFIEEDSEQMSLESIVSSIFLVVDNDKDEEEDSADVVKKARPKKSAKETRLAAIKKELGQNFYRLEKREIENLLSPKVIKAIAEEYGATKGLDNEIKQGDYADARMGTYLHETFGLKLADQYGTIRNKRKFAEVALSKITSLDDLSDEMKSLCKKIETFVAASNKI